MNCLTFIHPLPQASLIFKAGFDAGFLYLLYYIYDGYDLPRLTKCSEQPCPNTVDCYISRPTEKRIFTLFMVVSSAVCIFMCICEMTYLICKRVQKKINKNNQMFATSHEMTSLAAHRAEYRSKSSLRQDPTISIQNLSNIKAEETEPVKKEES